MRDRRAGGAAVPAIGRAGAAPARGAGRLSRGVPSSRPERGGASVAGADAWPATAARGAATAAPGVSGPPADLAGAVRHLRRRSGGRCPPRRRASPSASTAAARRRREACGSCDQLAGRCRRRSGPAGRCRRRGSRGPLRSGTTAPSSAGVHRAEVRGVDEVFVRVEFASPGNSPTISPFTRLPIRNETPAAPWSVPDPFSCGPAPELRPQLDHHAVVDSARFEVALEGEHRFDRLGRGWC